MRKAVGPDVAIMVDYHQPLPPAVTAPLTRSYVAARERGEEAVKATGIPHTFVHLWYVLGPGHAWPYALAPLCALARMFPPSRVQAIRLGLLTLVQVVASLVAAVETPPGAGGRIVDVPALAWAELPG